VAGRGVGIGGGGVSKVKLLFDCITPPSSSSAVTCS
jgi:hypothetical protein